MILSLVIPTYNEKENLGDLILRILAIYKHHKIAGEIIIVDDNSPDGTGDVVASLQKKIRNLKLIRRSGKFGLSSAVIEGWKLADGEILGVMDADFSHPPEKIVELFKAMTKGADLAIGSRYVKGGSIGRWSFVRKIISTAATAIARLFTPVKDPLSGFFMIRKSCIKDTEISPKGFKILLELLVKSNYKTVREIPFRFMDRTHGRSKIGVREIWNYLQNVAGYLISKRS
ncbi:polyprenol monophosphomannose synthase [Candidatus Woesearchaeota archaeon]|nr:polyprenol monophosphomannose synthase [Candidatus Woesearchaeota archaeon]